jgi:hypothetical protein
MAQTEYKKAITRGLEFKVLDDILYERKEAVQNDQSLKITNRWDLSDCFYQTRKTLDAMGYDVSKMDERRKLIHGHVKDWCDRQEIKRHNIGIFPADRAVMAFQGRLYSISFENYKILADLGVDVVLVEKEGTVNKLVPFTTELGIAFVQSEGFVAEYGEMLAEEIHRQDNNLAILADLDSSGIVLTHKIKGAIRLGVDLGVLDEFNEQTDENGEPFEQIDALELAESYNGASHWTYLKNLSQGKIREKGSEYLYPIASLHDLHYKTLLNYEYYFSDGTTKSYLEFLYDKRIELNTIMNEVQPQRFWNWLKDKLLEAFPTRNYNRAVTVPSYVLTTTMQKFQDKLRDELKNKLEGNVDDIKDAYFYTKNGFIDTKKSLEYTKSYLQNKLENDEKIQEIDSDLQDIINKLDGLNGSEEQDI